MRFFDCKAVVTYIMDDADRYRRALQRSLLTEGWEAAFDYDRLREWVQTNREVLRASARATLGDAASACMDEYQSVVESFFPRSEYDLPETEAIFRPLLDAVVDTARVIGLRLVREVELVTSTSVSPTPFARPTTGTHQLFIGSGTSAFCNYWAKAYTEIVKAIAAGGPPFERITSPAQIRNHLAHDPTGLLLATRLSLYYAVTGTLMGFGGVEQPQHYTAYRMELLQAMEMFALSHEYVHFLAHERGLEFADKAGNVSPQGLEIFCDTMGLQICRNWGSRNSNWLAFTGVGGLAFFRAVDLCETCAAELAIDDASAVVRTRLETKEAAHPPISDRVNNLIEKAVDRASSDQRPGVRAFLAEYNLICTTIGVYVSDVLREVAADTARSTYDGCP